MEHIAARMTWDDLRARAQSVGMAIVPAGSTERHGKHLPMQTDSATAFELACRVARKTGAVVFPTLPYGVMETTAFKGVFVTPRTYARMIREICQGIEALGFRRILFISGHGPNNANILQVLNELFAERPKERLLCMAHCMTLVGQLQPHLLKNRHIGHSDFRETSIMLAIDEEAVWLDRADQPKRIEMDFAGKLKSVGVHLIGSGQIRVPLYHRQPALESAGGYGDMEGASGELGEKLLSALAEHLAFVVRKLIGIRLPLP